MGKSDGQGPEIVRGGERFVPMGIAIRLYRIHRSNPDLAEQSLRYHLRGENPPIASIKVGGRYFVSVSSIEAYVPANLGREVEPSP